MSNNTRTIEEVQNQFQTVNKEEVKMLWNEGRPSFTHKIIVLDDDPTGVQTVHGVSVYTDWKEETIEQGFKEENQIFFILTNSRAFSSKETRLVHENIAERVGRVSQKLNTPYVIISRGDSTLRGHYPLETQVMKETIEQQEKEKIDGEIIIPFFKEGGRLTIDNIHYVQYGQTLVPAGETEFAKDRTFGFSSSHLGEWIEEKTEGEFKPDQITYISLESIRGLAIEEITNQLMEVSGFNKVVVNAIEEEDVQVFVTALIRAMNKGKQFMFRSAATLTKIIGNISSKSLLKASDLIEQSVETGGLIIVGSHVQKTTEQLKELKTVSSIKSIEFDCHLVLNKEQFKREIERVQNEAQKSVAEGITTVIYTKRERLDLGEGMKEEELKLSVDISDAVTSIVRNFTITPKYIIAKGGITSSDVGTKGLQVKRATVAGQIAPGVPVWKTGNESTFPAIPYIIFPGNVGSEITLKEIVLELEQ
jgi:uncharacterized protein YgbK (DUF1537 family)